MTHDDRKAALMALVRATPSPTRAEHRLRSLLVAGGAVALTSGLFLAVGGLRPGGALDAEVTLTRPPALILATALGAAVLAALAWWGLIGRGRSMLGRTRAELVLGSLSILSALLAWKLYASSQFHEMTLPWPARPGLKCVGLALLLGVWPLGALCFWRARADAVHPRTTGAAMGVAAGVLTWLLVDLWCPVAYPMHLLLGHVLPIVLLAGAGALVGGRWIAATRR